MTNSKLLGIYLAQFPFLDTGEAKIRPVVIISKPQGRHNVVAVVPVSSKTNREDVDVALDGWKDEKLLKPSVARVHRLTTVLQADLLAELGTLRQDDAQALQASLRLFLRL